ncbi:MAG: tetraacyldisaccharide 4'-kinase [Bacteroidales bacterium]|jgi:tetraacyldisaccharide 4'-kinase|nr:tetraacyldisaccharide 4'-kinase [Bacteroidales bacterium]
MSSHRSFLLYPFALVYRLVTDFRNFLYNTGILPSHEFAVPVISVGNLTVGGTGKTPHTEYLAGLLQKQFGVAILSRGYKRNSKGFRIVTAASTAGEAGDEPLQTARKYPGVIVAVDRSRKNGIRKIMQQFPETEVILLDDAFQHRQITPGLSILLSNCGRLMTRDHMLPYGNLREKISNMRRADVIIITKSPLGMLPMQKRLIVKEIAKAPYQHLFFTTVRYGTPQPLGSGSTLPPPDFSAPDRTGILLVTGIANPDPLKEFIQTLASEVIHLKYPDHCRFREKDIAAMGESFKRLVSPAKYIITTEKDAVRLGGLAGITDITNSPYPPVYYIPIDIDFLYDSKNDFNKLITDYVRKNKRDNRISEI